MRIRKSRAGSLTSANYSHQYYIKNRTRLLEKAKAYHLSTWPSKKEKIQASPDDQERRRSASRKWSAANPEKRKAARPNKEIQAIASRGWARANKEKIKIKGRAWRMKNREALRVVSRNRKARRRGAEGRFSEFDIRVLWEDQGGICAGINCDRPLVESCTVDHIFPVIRGGSSWPINIQLLCALCNSSKGSKTMEEWSAMDCG